MEFFFSLLASFDKPATIIHAAVVILTLRWLRLPLSNGPNSVDVPFNLRTETGIGSETSCSLVSRTPNVGQSTRHTIIQEAYEPRNLVRYSLGSQRQVS
jgi:hypothetical protein